MRNRLIRILDALFALSALIASPARAQNPAAPTVTWDSASTDSQGSMPLGNGDIGVNAWVERSSGDLLIYLSTTDAWDENVRLVKLGRVRIKFSAAPFRAGPFRQILR